MAQTNPESIFRAFSLAKQFLKTNSNVIKQFCNPTIRGKSSQFKGENVIFLFKMGNIIFGFSYGENKIYYENNMAQAFKRRTSKLKKKRHIIGHDDRCMF